MPDLITVRLAGPFRPQVGNQGSIILAGSSIREIFATLTRQFPELAKRLFKRENELNPYINVYINDEDMRYCESLESKIEPGDELSIELGISGG